MPEDDSAVARDIEELRRISRQVKDMDGMHERRNELIIRLRATGLTYRELGEISDLHYTQIRRIVETK